MMKLNKTSSVVPMSQCYVIKQMVNAIACTIELWHLPFVNYNIARHFSRRKVAFSALIKLQFLITVGLLTSNRRLVFQKHIFTGQISVSKYHA